MSCSWIVCSLPSTTNRGFHSYNKNRLPLLDGCQWRIYWDFANYCRVSDESGKMKCDELKSGGITKADLGSDVSSQSMLFRLNMSINVGTLIIPDMLVICLRNVVQTCLNLPSNPALDYLQVDQLHQIQIGLLQANIGSPLLQANKDWILY